MAAADVPKWGFGQQPMPINPVPRDFIPYFSMTGDTRVDTDKIFLSYSSFAYKQPLTRQPAWDRIPTQSLAAPSSNRQIMRRVAICNDRQTTTPFVLFPNVSVVPVPTKEEVAFNQYVPRKVRRGRKYKRVDSDGLFHDMRRFSHAEHMHNLLAAKGERNFRSSLSSFTDYSNLVDVANNYNITSSSTTLKDKRDTRRGIRQITPIKRLAQAISSDRADKGNAPISLAPAGGNRYTLYNEILLYIHSAKRSDKETIDLNTVSIADISTALQNSRRDPRQRLAENGVPDLSIIEDEEEPESPTVIREPVFQAETRFPKNRLARLARLRRTSEVIKEGVRRLSDGFVKLVPGSPSKRSASPNQRSPSPTKSVRHTSSPGPKRSSPIYGSGLAATDGMSTESVVESPTRPGRTFRVPSDVDSSSVIEDSGLPETPRRVTSSPVLNYSRPIAPTPSQWNRPEPEPSTPATPAAQTAPVDPVTPHQPDSPIGLAALGVPTTPYPATPRQTENSVDLAALGFPATPKPVTYDPSEAPSFNFGESSPFRSSLSWMNSSIISNEPKRIKGVHQGRRRQSEPLLRKALDTQARRRSASPRKVDFDDNTFHDVISIASLFNIPGASSQKPAADIAADETSSLDTTITTTKPAPESTAEVTAPLDITMEKSVPNETTALVDTTTTTLCKPAAESAAQETAPDTTMEESVINETGPIEDATSIQNAPELQYASVLTENLWLRDLGSSPAPASTKQHDEQLTTTEPSAIEHPATTEPPTTTEQGVVNIDMRENPDIFGTHVSSPPAPAPIQNLSRIADDACDGHAKVVVTEENGRLFVRFKVSAAYAHMFPPSQGFNETLGFSPSVEFSTPRPRPGEPVQSSAVASPSPGQLSTPEPRSTESILQTPDISGVGVITRPSPAQYDTPELPEHDNTLVFGEPTTTGRPSSIRRAARRRSEVTPLKRATNNVMSFATTPKFASPGDEHDQTMTVSWDDTQDTTQGTPAGDNSTPPTAPAPAPEPEVAPAVDNDCQDFDSPGREFMRQFIERSRQTAANSALNTTHTTDTATTPTATATATISTTPVVTTTEAGSPVAAPTKRQPLGARSPNRGSPMKAKRKHDDDVDGEEKSPAKKAKVKEEKDKAVESIPKTTRKTKAKRQKAELAIDMTDLPTASTTTTTNTTSIGNQADELATATPVTRRSSRLRSQEPTSSAPKSSLPTPIKLSRAGAGRNGGAKLPKKARSEEDELARKTRANTKKNMGNAEFPADVLVRLAGQAEEDSDLGQESEGSASGRRVGWTEPLTKVQGAEPKKGRAKKATQGQTGIAKPKAKRATKVAEDLGVVANGTPAKPQRVTRSSARSRV
ncbi:hypothetical protein FBEOM_6713 [Fusarium beomiforme]|uniref:Uncharacterized protein n=1 Tax=Fusarium beomiforme TaxID=44412 RepID=A0A9P5DYB5_9HYPO|nr:hypothetical protein FBEOM_6713 [Fusarium beomiforme]